MAEHIAYCPSCDMFRMLKYPPITYESTCRSCAKRGERNPMYGKITHSKLVKHSKGYLLVWIDKNDFFYPMVQPSRTSYVYHHRLIMAKHLNRCLLPWELVHHKNGVKDDNRLENLELIKSKRYHLVDAQTKAYIRRLQDKINTLEQKLKVKEVANYA